MKFGELLTSVAQLRSQLSGLDASLLDSDDAAYLAQELAPLRHQLSGLMLSLGSRAVSSSASSVSLDWLASVNGVSKKQTRSQLALASQLSELPEVSARVGSGELSLEKAQVIARVAGDDPAAASELLSSAGPEDSFEQLHLHARRLSAVKNNSSDSRFRLRRSQSVRISTEADSMVTGQFQLLPDVAAGLMDAYGARTGDTSWEQAESFASLLAGSASSGGSSRPKAVFHLELKSDGLPGEFRVGPRAEMKGVGPIGPDWVLGYLADASMSLVGTFDNKLMWFAEADNRRSTAPLPEFIKRAIAAGSWDRCERPKCSEAGEQVDHICARVNGGENSVSNLQNLCRACHAAKTRRDAPWTADGIYAKSRAQREVRRGLKESSGSAGEVEIDDTG